MKKFLIFGLTLAMTMSLLTACGNGGASSSAGASSSTGSSSSSTVVTKTPEELATLYSSAITANGGEMVQYNPVFTAASEEDGTAFMLSDMFKLNVADMTAFGISASMMNVKAYGIAAVKPAQGKEEAVKTALQGFIDQQKTAFEFYLADQYEVAKAAKLETLADGTILMVMCEGQDEVFANIKSAIEKG